MLSGARSALLGGDAGDVRYPWYLINGRVRTAPRTFKNATALALVRTGFGEPPPPAVRPAELTGVLGSYEALRAAAPRPTDYHEP